MASGASTEQVAREIVEGLRAHDLQVAFVFADWRHDPHVIARETQRGLSPATVVGASSVGVIANGTPRDGMSAVGLGLYGEWVHAGVGVAPDLARSSLTRSRDAVLRAATAIGRSANGLDSTRHVAITLLAGGTGNEEAFCIGSAATAPQIRFIGGCGSTPIDSAPKPVIWVHGEVLGEAGAVVLLESELPFQAVTSQHLLPTDVKTVVTAASGRVIEELDGMPAVTRLRHLVSGMGEPLDTPRPTAYSFARYVDGVPYVRSIMYLDGELIHLACAVEPGHVLRIMRPGDLIGTTTRDLGNVGDRLGGALGALLVFSCMARHWEAASKNLDRALAGAYGHYGAVGCQSLGEQSGMLLVNHTLTGLAIGSRHDR